MQVVAGQPADPVLRGAGPGVAEDVRAGRHTLPELVGKSRQCVLGTPSARSPVQVNANVTQRFEQSMVPRASVADCTGSSISVSHARPPAAVSKVRNS